MRQGVDLADNLIELLFDRINNGPTNRKALDAATIAYQQWYADNIGEGEPREIRAPHAGVTTGEAAGMNRMRLELRAYLDVIDGVRRELGNAPGRGLVKG